MPKGMQPIYRQVLGANTATIAFYNIPQNFTDLKVLINGKTTGGNVGTVYMQLNGSTTGNKSVVGYGESSGSGSFSTSPTQGVHVGYLSGPVIDSTSTGITEIYIPSYKLFAFKQIVSMGYSEGNSSAYQGSVQAQHGSVLTNATPVTSLTFTTETTFATNTSFTLYGIGV
jgi:hypothetical protein